MTDQRLENLSSILTDENVVNKLKEVKSAEELFIILKESGVDFNNEEVSMIFSIMQNQISDDEMDEESLDSVAGGFGIVAAAAAIAISYACGYAYGKLARNKLGI